MFKRISEGLFMRRAAAQPSKFFPSSYAYTGQQYTLFCTNFNKKFFLVIKRVKTREKRIFQYVFPSKTFEFHVRLEERQQESFTGEMNYYFYQAVHRWKLLLRISFGLLLRIFRERKKNKFNTTKTVTNEHTIFMFITQLIKN